MPSRRSLVCVNFTVFKFRFRSGRKIFEDSAVIMLGFTVNEILTDNLPSGAERPAIETAREIVTYGQLCQQVSNFAAELAELGVRRGDRVGIHLAKSIEEIVATFAVARLGAVFVNINHLYTLQQVNHILEDAGVSVLATDRRRAKLLAEAGFDQGLDGVLVTQKAGQRAGDAAAPDSGSAPTPLPACSAVDQDLAALMYTSGSTGRPKGVMLTHANVVAGARSTARYLRNSRDDRVLSFPPLSFDYGLNQVMSMFLVGGTVILQGVMMPAEIVKTVVEKRVTGLPLVAPAWVQLVGYLEETDQDLPSLRYVTNTGGKIPMGILEAMGRRFAQADKFLMYGLTEGFRCTYLDPERFYQKMGAIGRAIPNVETFVVDPVRGLCGPGETGELIQRGALNSPGYWRNQEATDEKFKVNPHLVALIGEEKVLHSGDLVRMDEDGDLWFVSRLDSMIKSSGYRISPTEIEEIIFASNLLDDVVAFGVEDETLGQKIEVAVSFREGCSADEAALQTHCRAQMPTFMVPSRVHVWAGPMPRTSSGKIDRPKVLDALKP